MDRTPERIAVEIVEWDLRDVADLRVLLQELAACRDESGEPIDTQAFVDMSMLPSFDIPPDIDTSYPVWAVDKSGRALVGDNADRIETLDQVRRP